MDGEQIVRQTNLHWVTFVTSFFLVTLGLSALLADAVITGLPVAVFRVGLAFLAIGLLALAITFLEYATTEFAVTTHRVVAKRGFIRRDVTEIDIGKIEGVYLKQNVSGRVLGYGTVVFRGTGLGENPMAKIEDPIAFANAARAIMREYREWSDGR